jgi:hypothetical protein
MSANKPLRAGKRCYGHVGGKLGERILVRFVQLNWLEPLQEQQSEYSITEKGRRGLLKLGVNLD